MADVRVLKFDVGSSTDVALERLKKRFDASTSSEAMRRSLAIADTVTELSTKGERIFVQNTNGEIRELLIGAQ